VTDKELQQLYEREISPELQRICSHCQALGFRFSVVVEWNDGYGVAQRRSVRSFLKPLLDPRKWIRRIGEHLHA